MSTSPSQLMNPALLLQVFLILAPFHLLGKDWGDIRSGSGIGVVYGYTSCTGCGEANDRYYTTVFPTWGCLIDDIDTTPRETFGITTPNGKNECECHFAELEDFEIPNAMMPRFPHYCEFNKEDDAMGPGVNSCACSMSYEHLRDGLCPSTKEEERCDYTWTCGDTQYVCWDLIHPKDLMLFNDLDSADDKYLPVCGITINDDVTTVVYCGNDLQDNPFNLYPNDGDPCEDICEWDTRVNPDDPLSLLEEPCPNGQLLSRFTKFCTPLDNVQGSSSNSRSKSKSGSKSRSRSGDNDGENDVPINEVPPYGCTDCDLPFCDYEGREFKMTHYTNPPMITCQDNIRLEASAGTCNQQVRYEVAYGPITFSPSAVPTTTPEPSESPDSNSGSRFLEEFGEFAPSPLPLTPLHQQQHAGEHRLLTSRDIPTVSIEPSTSMSPSTSQGPTTDEENCEQFKFEQIEGIASGEMFPVGTTTNTFVVRDRLTDISASCSLDVEVFETTAPIITLCPTGTIEIPVEDLDTCTASYEYEFRAEDACGISVLEEQLTIDGVTETTKYESVDTTIELTNKYEFAVGATVSQSFTVEDVSGNSATCDFEVIVQPHDSLVLEAYLIHLCYENDDITLTAEACNNKDPKVDDGFNYLVEYSAYVPCANPQPTLTYEVSIEAGCLPPQEMIASGQVVDLIELETCLENGDMNKSSKSRKKGRSEALLALHNEVKLMVTASSNDGSYTASATVGPSVRIFDKSSRTSDSSDSVTNNGEESQNIDDGNDNGRQNNGAIFDQTEKRSLIVAISSVALVALLCRARSMRHAASSSPKGSGDIENDSEQPKPSFQVIDNRGKQVIDKRGRKGGSFIVF